MIPNCDFDLKIIWKIDSLNFIQNYSEFFLYAIFFSQSCLLAFQVDILYQNHMSKY